MRTFNYFVTVLLFSVPVKSIVAAEEDLQGSYRDARVTDVRLTNSNKRNSYGILEVFIEKSWTAVCDDSFDDMAAKLACRQLNYVDGRFQPGSAVGRLAQVVIKAVQLDCLGNETDLSQCVSNVSDNCLSQNYVTLFCSHDTIAEKECVEIRLQGRENYGLLEANQYGFWGPICDYDWTDLEADAACRELGKAGGYAYFAVSNSDVPMVVGRFNCSYGVETLKHCDFKGFGESLGCQYPITNGYRRAAGVFCYEHEDGVQFSLSDRWYGKIQVKHEGEWGRVCNKNWGDKEASTFCRQLGYVDGHAKYTSGNSNNRAMMNNVNCTGFESSILECSHTSSWTGKTSPCRDAQVVCNITVCGTMDVRNSDESLNQLRHCNVIEGNLTILLIAGKWEDFQKYSFPNLVEITEFLLLFRVDNLRSLNQLFPNLAIIRGDRLFSDYALVAFEMPDLVELGLSSLVSIPRGAVRLEKNPNLCYIETVDWSKITTGVAAYENYFKGNKDVQECVNKCPNTCDETLEYAKKVPRCWTINDCQKLLSVRDNCPSGFYSDGVCCDSNCMAGCTGPSAKQCTTCKNVMERIGNEIPRCTQRCPAGTYMYKNRRCLLDSECLNFQDYRTVQCEDPSSRFLKNCLKLVVNEDKSKPGLCVADCPAKYDTDTNHPQKCTRCQGKCPKVCSGKRIDSVFAAQELKNCNIIKGPLQINIRQGGQIGKELEENLAQIEEITEFIIISHSEALMSLHFFKKLRKIGGEKLAYDKYILYVYDNLNLQELFLDEVAKNLQIGKGAVLFQYNRKLCYNKITQLISSVGLDINKIDSEEVSSENNGDQMPCQIQNLTLGLTRTSAHIAFLSWTKMSNITDHRHFIGYSIFWKEAPEKNVSIYNGRDACSNDLWKNKDVCTDPLVCTTLDYITGLEPWTQYAAYVKALTVSKSVQGGISNILYFRTEAEVPTPPVNLQVLAKVPGELEVTWDPPDKPNGNVTHYEVYWQKQNFDQSEYEVRNYCLEPQLHGMSTREREEKERIEQEQDNVTCSCTMSETQRREEERERNLDIQFQDYLQNQVYIKRLTVAATTILPTSAATVSKYLLSPYTDSSRKSLAKLHQMKKYSLKNNPKTQKTFTCQSPGENQQKLITTTQAPRGANDTAVNESTTTPVSAESDKKIEISDKNTFLKADVYDKRKFIITGLSHFEDYNIEVIACHTRPSDPRKDMLCGNQALGFGRTLRNDKADNINASLARVFFLPNRTGAVHIKWQDPPNPNGLILTYDIEYMNQNINNVKPILICITYAQYRDEGKGGHIIDKLDPGNYTFRLRATSLAQNGSWTEPKYFQIPAVNEVNTNTHMVIAVSITCVVAIPIAVIVVWFIARRKYVKMARGGVLISTNPDYPEMSYYVYEPDEWEVARDNVVLLKDLGQGSFGMVYMGIVKNLISGGGDIKVAVKTTNENSTDHDRYEFLQEASIMKQFSCHHVVKLIGVVSQGQPAYVLMELMSNGDLKHFLRLHRPDEEENDGRAPPTLKHILQMAGEIADGMAYLADKKFVHRDLAARNCMVGEDMTVKIGDFGMTRDIYETDYYRKGSRGLLPVRWMPPESLKDGVFTSLTDVWSYGVVLWEMATLAAQPYQGLSNEQVLKYVGSGKIMDAPEGCPTRLYDLMVKCWRFKPKQRPTFKEIIELLLPDLDPSFRDVSYFFSEESSKYEEAKHTSAVSQSHDDDNFESIDKDDEDDELHRPMNDYVDEAHLPMLGVGASNGHDLELRDICSDTGTYPHYSSCSSNNRQPDGSAEVCDCNLFREQAGAAGQSLVDIYRRNHCPSPNSSVKGGSSDGSKESSKSSSSSYAHMNGISVANGHVPIHLQRTTPC